MDIRYHTVKKLGPMFKINRFPSDLPPMGGNPGGERSGDNDKRLDQSLSRTKTRVLELALCNEWSIFFTGTFSPAKFDRYDIIPLYKKLTQGIRDLNRTRFEPIQYVFVPEHHKDGAWHIHGLIMGLTEADFSQFDPSVPLPYHILNKIRRGEDVWNWPWFARNFGFCDLEPVHSPIRSAFYISKYITKDLVNEVQTHIYRASIGLNRAYSYGAFLSDKDTFHFDHEGKYCSVSYVEATLDVENFILSFFSGEVDIETPFEVDEPPFSLEPIGPQFIIAGWCNGNMLVSSSSDVGSIPSPASIS